MSYTTVAYAKDGRIARVTFNRPEIHNAFNGTVIEEMADVFKRIEAEDDIRVVLLTGKGKSFCAGADLSELESVTTQGPEASLADANRLGDLLLQMRRHPRPIVAAVHGRALAGGCGLATACDLILAHQDAEFGYPEVHLGFVPAMVMAILRKKVGESRAFDLVAMGRRISAGEAASLGLVNRVFDAASFREDVEAFVQDLGRRPPEALRLTKSLLYEMADLTMEDGIRRGAQVNVEARQNEECKEGVRAFLARRRGGPS